jgi:uncharacterized secreted protein with C-terminal beta-propeller domain
MYKSMRRSVFYLLLAVLGFVALPSCSKDEKEKEKEVVVDYALEIAKTYEGALKVEDDDPVANTIVIERTGENKVKLTLKQFIHTPSGINFGDIVMDDIAVTKNGDAILFSVEKKMVTVTISDASVSITVNGTSSNGSLELNINMGKVLDIEKISAYFTTDKSILPPPVTSGAIWAALDGTYNGTLIYTVRGTTRENPSVVTIEKKGGWEIQLSVNGVPMLETITFSDITVTENSDETCTFSGTFEDSLCSATITGSANELGKVEFSGSIDVAAMGTSISISYTGSK